MTDSALPNPSAPTGSGYTHPGGSDPPRLEFQDVSAGYNGHPAIEALSFVVPPGARVAVVGPNGAGKSTLFKALVGLLPVSRGRILIHDQPLGTHPACVAYIPQREAVDWRFPVTVWDVALMGRFGRNGWLRPTTADDRRLVRQALDEMGIANLAQRSIGDLSGGQQQRVFLARALAQEPHLLLMDEPFGGVDAPTQEATLEALDRLRERGVTVLVSTHDLSLAAQRFDLALLLNRRLLAFGPPREVFQPGPVQQAFGSRALFLDGMLLVDECCPGDEAAGSSHAAARGSGRETAGSRGAGEGRGSDGGGRGAAGGGRP